MRALIFKLFLSSPFHLTFFRSLKSFSSHFTPVRPPWSQFSTHMDCCKNHQTGLVFPPSGTLGPSLAKIRGAFYDQPLLTPLSITYATHSTRRFAPAIFTAYHAVSYPCGPHFQTLAVSLPVNPVRVKMRPDPTSLPPSHSLGAHNIL